MCDNQHPPGAQCGPEGLLKQMRSLCALKGVPLSGENALSIFQVLKDVEGSPSKHDMHQCIVNSSVST
jgi:hypothetical protein